MAKLKHPDSNRSLTVADEQVPMYESQGWVVQSEPKK